MEGLGGFIAQFWFRKSSKFSYSRFGSGFGSFLTEEVRSSSFKEGFEWVRSLVLVDKAGFE